MSGLIHPLPFEPRASGRSPKHKDTSGTCADGATADLLESVTMITSNERLTLAGSELRASLLDRVEKAAEARVKAAAKGLSA